jgi:hypothetical protein
MKADGEFAKEDSMRLALATAACIGLSVFPGAVPLLAQMQNNTEKQMT